MTETRPDQVVGNAFEYEQYEAAFKPGDLFIYSGTGIIASVTKVCVQKLGEISLTLTHTHTYRCLQIRPTRRSVSL